MSKTVIVMHVSERDFLKECIKKFPIKNKWIINNLYPSFLDTFEENVTLPQFDSKTNNIIHEIHITENETRWTVS